MSSDVVPDPLNAGGLPQHGPLARQPAMDDSELWLKLNLRDEQAIAQLYDRYSPLIFRVADQVLHDRSASEDVTQEVFLQVWRVPRAFDPAKGSLEAWLTVVSRRRAIDRLRQRREEIDVDNVVLSTGARQLADAAQNQISERVRLVLEGMPEKLRTPFVLAYAQGLTHGEISQRTGDPLGTTKSRIRQALNWIRKKLDPNGVRTNSNGHA